MGEELGNEETRAVSLLLDHMNAYHDTMLLRCAIQLNLPDTIHQLDHHSTGVTLSHIAGALPRQPVNQNHLLRIVNYLVRMGLLSKHMLDPKKETTYTLTMASELFLLSKSPTCLRPYIMLMTSERSTSTWHAVSAATFTQASVLEVVHGVTDFEDTGRRAEMSAMYNEAMAAFSRLQLPTLVRVLEGVLGGVRSLVDVGGGSGTAAARIAEKFPHVWCSVLDLPHVAAAAATQGGVEFIQGNMFEHIPNNDVVMIMRVLHDWPDEACLKILERCKEAIPRETGKVVIVDMIMEEAGEEEDDEMLSKWMMRLDLAMMVFVGGKERSRREWDSLLDDAGFYAYKITPTLLGQYVIEARLK